MSTEDGEHIESPKQ
ncbi:hypothetical protein GWI33_001201, partial [Rhynchophorus ferrugineus]